jgi:hypothetical protein
VFACFEISTKLPYVESFELAQNRTGSYSYLQSTNTESTIFTHFMTHFDNSYYSLTSQDQMSRFSDKSALFVKFPQAIALLQDQASSFTAIPSKVSNSD